VLLFLFLIGCMIYIRVNWWLYFLFHKVMSLYFFSFPRRSRVNSKEIKSKVTLNLRLPSLKKNIYITSILTFNYPIKPSNKKKCLTGRPRLASAPASRGNNIEARIRSLFRTHSLSNFRGKKQDDIWNPLASPWNLSSGNS